MEKNNLISISVYSFCTKTQSVKCVRHPVMRFKKKVALLLLKKKHVPVEKRFAGMSDLHYASILNVAAFFAASRHRKTDYCVLCNSFIDDPTHIDKCVTVTYSTVQVPKDEFYSLKDLSRCMNSPRLMVPEFLYANKTSQHENHFDHLSLLGLRP